jgi:hypothetical protein
MSLAIAIVNRIGEKLHRQEQSGSCPKMNRGDSSDQRRWKSVDFALGNRRELAEKRDGGAQSALLINTIAFLLKHRNTIH